jgi:hypothetical protein
MTRLPIVDFKKMEKVLRRLGFEAVRQKGAHIFYRHPMEEPQPFQIIREETSPAPDTGSPQRNRTIS